MITDQPLRIRNLLSLLSAISLTLPSVANTATAMTYPGAAFFDSTPAEWEVKVTIDELSGGTNNLVEVFVFSDDDETETLIDTRSARTASAATAAGRLRATRRGVDVVSIAGRCLTNQS